MKGRIYRPRLIFWLAVGMLVLAVACSALWRWWEPPA